MSEIKRYFSYLGKYKRGYWINFCITLIVSACLQIAYSYMNKMIFNSVEYQDRELFSYAVVFCVIVVVLNCVFPYLRYFQIRIVRKIVFDIKIKLFHKLMKLDMAYYEKHHSAEALKILNWDANSLKDSYFSHVYWVVGKIVDGVTAMLAMMLYSPYLAVISIGFSFVTVLVSMKINQRIKTRMKDIQTSLSNLAGYLSDILSGLTILKMYSGASIVVERFQNENEEVTKQEEQRVKQSAILEMLSFLLGILGSFGTILVGALLVAQGKADYGTVMAVVSLQMSVSVMVQKFGSSMATFSSSLVKAGRVFDFMEQDGEEDWGVERGDVGQGVVVHEGVALEVNKRDAPIILEDVTFSYDGKENVLNAFDMKVSDGEKVLLMGESGCGKSTILKLLLRFYENNSGRILMYGRAINDYSLPQLRDMITYIPQENYLFEGTVRENIALGNYKESVTEDKILRAAKLAYADEFIRELPMGYDTHIAAGGSNLSGGQRQRIAIARAFLKDSPILLMDEPSSALDVHSEKMINLAMEQLMKEKTVLLVTHRELLLHDVLYKRIEML